MHTLRRTLNVFALGFIALAAIGLALVMQQQPGSSSIPFTFVALFAALPAAFHGFAALWSWPKKTDHPNRWQRLLLGVSFSSIALFAWVVAGSAFIELALRKPVGQWQWQWQHAALALAVVLLPFSSAVNLQHFRKGLATCIAE